MGRIYYSPEAKREYMLLYPPDHVFEDEDAPAESASASRSWLGSSTSPKAERVRRQLVLMLTRKFKIQELVAEAYLAVADWDPLRAIDQYRKSPRHLPAASDAVWCRQSKTSTGRNTNIGDPHRPTVCMYNTHCTISLPDFNRPVCR